MLHAPREDELVMTVEPISNTPPRPVRRAMLVQRWCDLTFLHWPVPPETVAPLLPAGTRPDVLDGSTYVGLIPFRMSGVGLLSGPGLPYLGTFCETNVRLYSVDDHGRRGVVFVSLDAGRLAAVLAGRLGVRLPYIWSRMRMERRDGLISYRCRRRTGTPRPSSRIVVRPGHGIEEPGPVEVFLTARWGLHASWFGRTVYLPNEHRPWPLHRAGLLDLQDDLLAAAGFPVADTDPVSVLYSPGVAVRFGAPVRVGSDERQGRT